MAWSVRLLLLLLGLSAAGAATARETLPPDEIIVVYHDTPAPQVARHGPVARRLRVGGEVLPLPRSAQESRDAHQQRLRQRIAEIRRDPRVRFAEPNYRGRFEEVIPPAPNDPAYGQQWWLPYIGDRTLWAFSRGSGITVAVIDTGVDLTHPDLAANLLPGYDFGDNDSSPQDQLGHGTRVAGVLAAVRNNQTGVSGLAPEARLLPLKINVGGSGTFASDALAQAIDYAIAQRVNIINLSLTVDQNTQLVLEAVQRALDRGIVVVAAAGNDGGAVAFPATMSGVIAVAAVGQDGLVANFSNRGPEISIAAPGAGIYTTYGSGTYVSTSGTSFAAPMVSAAIAAGMALNPELPASGWRTWLRATTRPIAGVADYGILDAGALAYSLVVRNYPDKATYSRSDAARLDYTLPPSGGSMDLYVAVDTPSGEYSLTGAGQWSAVAAYGYTAVAVGYQATAGSSGSLFGPGGIFPPIALSDLPTGTYTWRTAMVSRSSGRVIGDVVSRTFTIVP